MEALDSKFLGVCAWLARKLKADATWVRVGFVVLTVVGYGTPIVIYFVLFVLLKMKVLE